MQNDNSRIILFSGTTEGRTLSEMLEKNKIPHTVFVATDYGELLQPKGEYTFVSEGRKDLHEIKEAVKDAEVVVDATHPYATVVTENIRKAVEGSDKKLIRVVREEEPIEDTTYDGISYFDSLTSCKDALSKTEGNLLFTTGSKDLKDLCSVLGDMTKVYARVLPSMESLNLCEEAGVRKDHILALFGPFSSELNLAMIRQYHIDTLITKESGKAGGYKEKIEAAKEAGIKVFCIKRPSSEEGVSPRGAFEEIAAIFGKREKSLILNIIGAGMGGEGCLLPISQRALQRSDAVFGAERLIRDVKSSSKYPLYLSKDITEKIDELISKGQDIQEVSVLFSGDIGFFSGAAKFEEGILTWSRNRLITLIINRFPGVSSVSYLSARLGESYSDAAILSLHGRNEDSDIKRAAETISHNKKSFVLLSSADDAARLSKALGNLQCDADITLSENLSYEDEKLTKMTLSEGKALSGKGLFTMFIENKDTKEKLLIPTIEDDEFLRNKTPMTKAIIRHEVIRSLLLKQGDVLYDIGSGTGSVAIEAAGLSDTLKVFSFEKSPEALSIQKQNIKKFGALNITLIEGEAPAALDGITPPDAVFIGGAGGNLSDIIKALRSYGKSIRVVMTAVTLETMEEMSALRNTEGVTDLQIQQITCSRAQKAGDYHLMKTENSVMMASFILQ